MTYTNSFNIDGIPLFKSSRKTLWPILCAIHLVPQKVFPVALCLGVSKPANLDFLVDTIQDLNQLLQHGLQCDDKTIQVKLRAIVCDAPAKAMVKAIKQYSGYQGCDKCTQGGLWVGRMTYPETQNVDLRTDASFRNHTYEEHHHGVSPLCDLPIDMIKRFPIDYMHQVCLGVMKKLLVTWMRGKKEVKMSSRHCEEISTKLTDLQRFIPSNFARKPRGLDEMDRWKANRVKTVSALHWEDCFKKNTETRIV